MRTDFDPQKVAEFIANGWKAHHEKNWDEVRANLVKEHKIRYALPQKSAEVAADLYIKAEQEHDLAEKLMDEGDEKSSKYYWESVKRNLALYLTLLQGEKNESS